MDTDFKNNLENDKKKIQFKKKIKYIAPLLEIYDETQYNRNGY